MIAFDGYLDGDNRVRDEGHTFVALCTAHQTTIYLNQKDSFTYQFHFPHGKSIKPCKDIFRANKQNGTFSTYAYTCKGVNVSNLPKISNFID